MFFNFLILLFFLLLFAFPPFVPLSFKIETEWRDVLKQLCIQGCFCFALQVNFARYPRIHWIRRIMTKREEMTMRFKYVEYISYNLYLWIICFQCVRVLIAFVWLIYKYIDWEKVLPWFYKLLTPTKMRLKT